MKRMLVFQYNIQYNYWFTGKLRLGYAYEAGLLSEKTHKIPACGFKLANDNYVAITNNIKRMLRQEVNLL
jgi:hypothetical protein